MDIGIKTDISPHPGLGFKEFVALIAALMATNALAVDGMLPALGKISTALGLTSANERQWVITAYMIGMGGAQIFYGTLADRFGRKPMITAALVIYICAALAAAFTRSFELMLTARMVQGVGAAGLRMLPVSIVRDCYEGRRMAQVMSLSLLVFLGVPILAPSFGQLVMLVAPWPMIFVALAMFAAAVLLWVTLRLPETLRAANRRPIRFDGVIAAARLTLSNRASLFYTLAATLITGCMFSFVTSSQQVFATVFNVPNQFPLLFAACASGLAVASITNARLVVRFGSRRISHTALLGYICISAIQAALAMAGHETLLHFMLLQVLMMFCSGLMMGNFNAMAMQPMGAIAGSAASIQGFIATLGAAIAGFAIGQSFNGTVVPLTVGFFGLSLAALGMVLVAERGRLFDQKNTVEVGK